MIFLNVDVKSILSIAVLHFVNKSRPQQSIFNNLFLFEAA